MKTVEEVLERANILKSMNQYQDRARIRAVMNGGALGVQAVLNGGVPFQGPGSGKGADTNLGVDLPTANIMHSGMERMAQKIGRPPTLKTDMLPIKDNNTARKKAEKRARIVTGWDETASLDMQFPQIARWLLGYAFTLHVVRERDFGGVTIPVAELRDPYDVYPGMWGPDQQPTEVAVYRHVSRKEIRRTYPELAEVMKTKERSKVRSAGIPIIGQTSGWEGNPHGPLTVIEYMCNDGTYIVCPEYDMQLGFVKNPLTSGPAFVMTKKFSFDQLQGQFHHAFGLMAMMAKLNILGLIGVEDSNFRETNIIGELVGNTYERGRFAVNTFEPGTRIERPTSDQLQQTWQAVNTLERQFRIVSGYPVADDGQSPNSFATGRGIEQLGASADLSVKEYQTAIAHSIELIDRKRLEWEEVMHPQERKRVYWYEGGTAFEETYIAEKDIAKDYRTKRVFGAMATFDENSKIVAGLQLVQARVMDRRTLQENLDNFGNVTLVNERIDQDMSKEMLLQSLGARAQQGDTAADLALVEIMDNPGKIQEILNKLFTPQDPQMSPEEAAMMQGGGMGMGGPGGEGLEGGPPPAIQTIMAQMEAQGGGVQSVGQM